MNELSNQFQSFYEDRIQSNIDTIKQEYLSGRRCFDKYDIEDNYNEFNGLVFDGAQFTRCFIEACFTNCSFEGVLFSNCNLKTISFSGCNLRNSVIEECSIESICFTASIMEGIKFGTNYSYGVTLNGDAMCELYLPK